MTYIIVFRNSHREPHIHVDDNEFLERFSSYESAKNEAEKIIDHQGADSPWYFDYQIYQEAES